MRRVTLTQYLIEQQRSHGKVSPELRLLLEIIARACKAISHAVSKGPLAGIGDTVGTQNVQGEAQKRLDVMVDVDGLLAAPVDPVPSYDDLLALALQNRPELGELNTQQGIYAELIKIAAAGNKPRVDFAANWGKRHLALETLSSTGTAWNAGIFATVPIFDGWRTRGQVVQVTSTRASLDIDELKLREGITLEVRTAVDNAREAVALLDALNGPVTQAERLLFLAEKGYELGVKTRLEVQDAEQNVNVARANLAAAQRDYRVARVNLDWVAGILRECPRRT